MKYFAEVHEILARKVNDAFSVAAVVFGKLARECAYVCSKYGFGK